jgi:hypothetical protein
MAAASTALGAGDLASGLVGHWTFDEATGGVFKDHSGLGQDGPASSTARRVQGKSECAIQFDGASTFIHAKLKTELTSYTFSAWAKPGVVPTSMSAICGRRGHHNDIGYTPDKRFYFETFNLAKQGFVVTSEKEYEPGAWHHVVGAFDQAAATLTLYVDGEVAGQKPFTGEHFQYGGDFFIGCASPGSAVYGYWFNGAVDDVRVYNRALSALEVRALHDELSAHLGPAEDPRYGAVGQTGQPAWFEPKVEIVPPVDDALRAHVAAMPPVSAAVGRAPNGLPTLLFNDAAVPFMGGDVWWGHGMSRVFLAPYFEAGMEIINIQVNIALGTLKISPTGTRFMTPYWVGKGQYDPSGLEPVLWRPLRSNPNAKIILWLIIDPYPEWPAEHPEELTQNEHGEYAHGASHFSGYSKELRVSGLGRPDRSAWSFFSESFRDETSDMLANFVRDVDQLAPGRAVAGYIIGGGVDYQLYPWNPPNKLLLEPGMWSDYSPAARKAWRAWLNARYGADEKIAAAWGVGVEALGELEPPKFDELQGTEFFHDPTKERRAMDWKRFITSGRQGLVSHFAGVLKAASTRPVIVGICSGNSGGRRDTTTVEEFVRDPNIDFLFTQPTYSQRIPPNLGGINAHLASHAVNGKLFLLDLDHPTWLTKPTARVEIGAGLVHDETVQGWAKDIETLRAMWRREFAHLWTVNAGAFWDHVFGHSAAYADPSIIAEMKFLVDLSKSVKKPSPQAPPAEVALVFDEKAVDYLKQGVGLHAAWTQVQMNELNASGVPYGAYYAEDLRDGKVPKAKMYILQNLMNLDERLLAAIEKLKADGATLVFLRDTGYEQSFTAMDTVSKAVGMTLARRQDAPPPAFRLDEKHPLVNWESETAVGDDDPSVTWPAECAVFGPFAKATPLPGPEVLATMPSTLSLDGTSAPARRVPTKGDLIDLQMLFGGPTEAERVGYVFFEVESSRDQEVTLGAGADWWMQWWVNGKPAFDTLEKGNERADYTVRAFPFKVQLRRGRNILVARVLSGSAGFVLAAGGPNELNNAVQFSPIREAIKQEAEFTLAVVDPDATVLSAYADDPHAGFAVKDNGSHTSVFVGTRVLSRNMIAALAKHAHAWRLTDPGTVSEATEDLIMLHPLAAGPVTVRLKAPAALVECEPGTRESASALTHRLDLPAGGTYLFLLRY